MTKNFVTLLVTMALTTYLVRMIPFTFFRSQIRSKFMCDLLYYIPYCVLGAMTVPYIFYAGGSVASSLCGFVAALVMAYCKFPLLGVAAVACVAAYVSEFLIGIL